MAVEDDILKTLRNIEKILGNGSNVASGLGRSAPRVAGGASNNDTARRREKEKQENDRNKTYRATTASLNLLNTSTATLNRSFTGLAKTVLSTRAGFIGLNRSMRQRARTPEVREPTEKKPTESAASKKLPKPPKINTDPFVALPKVMQQAARGMFDTVREMRAEAAKLAAQAAAGPAAPITLPPPVVIVQQPDAPIPVEALPTSGVRGRRPRAGSARARKKQSKARPARSNQPQPNTPVDEVIPPAGGGGVPPNPANGPLGPRGPLGGAIRGLSGRITAASSAVIAFTAAIGAAIVPVTRDVLMLHSAGIQASSALGGLYVDAARSGLSLQEYTKVLQSSSVAVTRAGSMDDFNDTLQISRDRLENLGIFGAEATRLAASLATSTTTLGIPQEQLAAATNAQIDTFERLRKTSLLTAEEFQKLSESLADNQTVQSQLLGMAPQQRAARQSELLQIRTLGLSMGATKKASDALSDAIIAQRNATAPKRFEAAGLVRQAGAMLGQDVGATETLARLSRKKNLTAEEAALGARLAAPLQAAIERELNSGDISREFRAEQIQERLMSNGFGKFLQASGNVALTASSGPAGVNQDFAKGASDLLKATGRLLAWTDGLEKNTIIKSIGAGVLGAIVTRAIGGLLMGRVAGGGLISGLKTIIDGTYNVLGRGVKMILGVLDPRNWGGMLTRIVNGGKNAVSTIVGAVKSIGGVFSNIGTLGARLGGIGQVFSNAFARFGPMLRIVPGLLKGIPVIGSLLGVLIDTVGELFSGNVFAAFNADGEGNILERIGNIGFAVVNGFISSFGAIGDWVVSWFTNDGFNIENALNRWAVTFKSSLLNALAWAADFIPGIGGKMSAYFKGAAKDSDNVLKQLEEDKTATVISIGKQRNADIDSRKKNETDTKALADKTVAAQARITAANAGILTSTTGITSNIVETARSIAAPAASPVKTVTPPTVNRAETETTPTASTTAETPPPAAPPPDAIVAQLIAMNQLLTQMLTAEQAQAAGITSLASAAGRPTFANNEFKFDILQGNRFAG